MGFQFEQHRLGLWYLSWDLKKTVSWEMGLGPPLHDPLKKPLAFQVLRELYFYFTVKRNHQKYEELSPPQFRNDKNL